MSSSSAASSTRSAVASACTSSRSSCRRARTPRHYAEIVRETATLRGLIRAGGEIAQLGWEREGEPAELVARAEDSSSSSPSAAPTASSSSSRTRSSRRSSASASSTRTAPRSRACRAASRISTTSPAGFQPAEPHHPRRPPVDGKERVRARDREPRRGRRGQAVRVLQPRDVAAGGRAAPHVLARESRRAPHPHGQALEGRLAAAHQGVRPARGGAALRRRHAGPQPPRAPRPRADAEAPPARPRPHRRRLPPADDDRPQRGEPPAGGLAASPATSRRSRRTSTSRSSPSPSSTARPSSATTSGRCSPTSASRARSSRTPTW